MLTLALSLAFLAAGQPANPVPPAPRPMLTFPEHSVPPAWRTVETVYACNGQPRRILLRYTQRSAEPVRITRHGSRPTTRDMIAANAALAQFDAVTTVLPECGSTWDVIMVFGHFRGRNAIVSIVWSDREFRASEPIQLSTEQPTARASRSAGPAWEGAGVYAFGALLLDLNRGQEGWVPGRTTPLFDCSTEQLYCLTARRGSALGEVAFVLPRTSCASFRVGESWRSGEVQTSVLARVEPSSEPIENALDYHRRQTATLYYLGDASNPQVVYEYTSADGIVAVYHGLTTHPELVEEVRRGLNPATLPPQHRGGRSTFDRLAPCAR